MIKSVNPYSGQLLAEYKPYSDEEILEIVSRGATTFSTWSKRPLQERCALIKKVGSTLRENIAEFSGLMSREMGKPVSQARAELEKCAWLCDYYSEHAETFLKDFEVKTDAVKSYVSYEPLGVILAVMPWNYPFWQVFRFAVPTLLAGNTCLLKHASNVMGCAGAIEKIFTDCGFPEGAFQNLVMGSKKVALVLEQPSVKAVSLTGSEAAGRAVAAIAGKNLKSSLLELGGSNAALVLKDADLHATADIVVNGRFQNTGQSCIAAKRLLLAKEIADEFLELLLEKVRNLRSGDPMDEDTYIGVLAREDLAKELEDQLQRSLSAGAELLTGGKRDRAYFAPTVIKTSDTTIPAMQEETFGPLLCVYVFDDLDEAISVANSSSFGLGVSVFTENVNAVAQRIAEFEEGAVFINEWVKSDPRLPFGGINDSGYGRELGLEGIRAFVNTKTVYIGN